MGIHDSILNEQLQSMSDNDNNGQSDTDEQLSGKQSQSEYNDSDNAVQIDSGNESSM